MPTCAPQEDTHLESMRFVFDWCDGLEAAQQEFGEAAMRTGQKFKASPSWVPVGRQEFAKSRCSCRQCQNRHNVVPNSRGVGVEERLEVV